MNIQLQITALKCINKLTENAIDYFEEIQDKTDEEQTILNDLYRATSFSEDMIQSLALAMENEKE